MATFSIAELTFLCSRICWFDLDLSSTPYKTLKYHEKAVRSVAYHAKYPLMASASDDGTIHIFHAMVYSYVAITCCILLLTHALTLCHYQTQGLDEEPADRAAQDLTWSRGLWWLGRNGAYLPPRSGTCLGISLTHGQEHVLTGDLLCLINSRGSQRAVPTAPSASSRTSIKLTSGENARLQICRDTQ